jgi:hypothetical protein
MGSKGFLLGLKITIQVKFSNHNLLIIGSGAWPRKINAIIQSNNKELNVSSIGARKFLSFSPETISQSIDNQNIWIATRPNLQIEILNKIATHNNKVIIEKPFATNVEELEATINIFNQTSNRLYLSEPWKHSKIWTQEKNSISSDKNFQSIFINRGGPIERTYINPAWDWIQHDLGLIGELFSGHKEDISINLSWLKHNETLNISLALPDKFKIDMTVGYFPEKIGSWKINGKTKIDFINSGGLNDNPIYTMYEYVASENFQSRINEQIWLTNKIITLLNSKSL